MSSSSTHLTVRPRPSPEVSTRWRCVWILAPISAPRRAAPELPITTRKRVLCSSLRVATATSPLTLALHVAQMACFCQCQPAARMHSISAPNQPPVRPSRLGAKSNRTINQKKDEAAVSFCPPSSTYGPSRAPPPPNRRVVSSDLSGPIPLPLLSSLALTFGYKFLLCRGFRLPFPFRSRSHISRSVHRPVVSTARSNSHIFAVFWFST